MLNGDGWTLGSMVRPAGEVLITEGRPLSADERERIPAAMERLRGFSGHALIGPLVDALTGLNEMFNELASLRQADFYRGPYRSRLNGRMSAALTAFTAFRATVEANARALKLPFSRGSSAPANFDTLYRQHPSYRLIHMLRNLDQHRPPASAVLTVSVDHEPDTGKSRTRPVVDVNAVCDQMAAEPQRSQQWRECGVLWADKVEPVDIREVFEEAFSACNLVLASYIREAEGLVLADTTFLAALIVEIEPWGAACAMRIERSTDANQLNISQLYLDPLVLGEALVTVDAARAILGLPPHADENRSV